MTLSINGVSIAPKEKTMEIGRRLLEYRIETISEVIHRRVSGHH